MAQAVTNPPIPHDIRQELPDPLTPWGISERIVQQMKTPSDATLKYKKCQVLPTDPEWRFVWRMFHHNKPTNTGHKLHFGYTFILAFMRRGGGYPKVDVLAAKH